MKKTLLMAALAAAVVGGALVGGEQAVSKKYLRPRASWMYI